ncbi:hypothetical protein G3I59_26890 [Amycolatopsis rubida]|uniref:Uncharacterized protein n=1 Tax=Amycolatopsis rubida TaxID=112413 RepID=A0A1I5YEX1_9PSEU|nr:MULTISPECIES: hypothetical protein [Amycolatopsis]MYW94138.1 hypothetical protein [Amycolatopsis rubida]NEC59127.1 hypothetical protein [Amycolatopsis rubida]SFQ42437.1 hypothetical protein SAMN05421854_11219 [Amycolatopsis rubida]
MAAVDWSAVFEAEARRRKVRPQPAWGSGAPLDPVVARSVRRFQHPPDEAEDRRLLARLLETASQPGKSDVMSQLISDVLALGYYRALRDGARDPVTVEVAARVFAGAERRLSCHVDRLRRQRIAASARWRAKAILETGGVLAGHGRALRRLGVPWLAFVTDAWARFERALEQVRRGPSIRPGPRVRARPRGLL